LDDENWEWLSGVPGRSANEAIGLLRARVESGAVSEGLTVAQTEILDEMLDLVRGLPDRAAIKEVVREAGRELRAEKGMGSPLPNTFVSEPVFTEGRDFQLPAGIGVGMPKKVIAGQIPCVCKHSGCRFGDGKFMGTRRGQDLCPDCVEKGHGGEPRDCKVCFDDMGPT